MRWSWSWRKFFSGVWFDRDFQPWLAWRLNLGPLHIVKSRIHWRNTWASWDIYLGRIQLRVTYRPARWRRRWGVERRDQA